MLISYTKGVVMKIYVHAGTHKTGSTSIQDICFINKKTLAEQGIYYPDTGDLTGHHDLAFFIQKREFERAKNYLDKEIKKAKENNCHSLLLSSEEFEFIYTQDRIKLFKQYGETEIIFFFRRQDELIEKEYEQIVKMPSVKYNNDIYKFYLEKWFQARINYPHIISLWEKNYTVRKLSYDLCLVNDTLIDDFLKLLPLQQPELIKSKSRRSNVSPPAIVTIYLTRLNKDYVLNDSQHLTALDYLTKLFKNHKDYLLPIEIRKVILNRYEHFNKNTFSLNKSQMEVLFGFSKYENKKDIDYYNDFSNNIYKKLLNKLELT